MDDQRSEPRPAPMPPENAGGDRDVETSQRPPKQRHRAAARFRQRLHGVLIALVVLSLASFPLITAPAQAADPPQRETPPPPAAAVRLLEQQRDRDANRRPRQQSVSNAKKAKPGQKAKPGKRAKPGRKAKPRRQRARTINRKGCVFRVRGKVWTLVRDCVPKGTIIVPHRVTLDGRNRRMIYTGDIARFHGAVIAAGFSQVKIRNLRIEGDPVGLTGRCFDHHVAILLYKAGGEIRNVTVRNTDLPDRLCGETGIYAFGSAKVRILGSTLHNVGQNTVILEGTVNGLVAGNNLLSSERTPQVGIRGMLLELTRNVVVRNNDFRLGGAHRVEGILANHNLGLVITGNRFHDMATAITVTGLGGPPGVVNTLITDNVLTGVTDVGIWLFAEVAAQVHRNAIIGGSQLAGNATGILLHGSTSLANNNHIANFNATLSCGISANANAILGAGAEANTFSNTTTDIC